MKPDKWLQPHCAVEMGSLFPLTTSSGGRAPTTDGSKEPAARSKRPERGIDSEWPITEALLYEGETASRQCFHIVKTLFRTLPH